MCQQMFWFFTMVSACLLLISGQESQELPILDPISCHNMCQRRSDCPNNAACMPIIGSRDCGACICTFGFQPVPGRNICVQKASLLTARSEQPFQPQAPPTPRLIPPPPTAVRPVPPVASVPQVVLPPSPPAGDVWDCASHECLAKDTQALAAASTNPDCFFSPPKRCGSSQGAVECHGQSECLELNKNTSACACSYRRAGTSCQIEKPKRCQQTTGITPETVVIGRRFIHIRIPDVGAIHGRHLSPTLEHCIRLCQWAGPSRCRSLNFGPIDGKLACELLTIRAPKGSALSSWLKSDPGWTYACCFHRQATQG